MRRVRNEKGVERIGRRKRKEWMGGGEKGVERMGGGEKGGRE